MRSGPGDDSRTWWLVFVLVFLASGTWALATPLMTGPDEGSQVRRAAAAARGQWNGVPRDEDPPIFVDVSVPVLYGEATDLQGRCFLGPVLDRSPQEPWIPHESLAADCPTLPSDRSLVEAPTNQGRGQPFFYVAAGAPTRLHPGPLGAYGSRLVVSLITAALVASAARTVGSSRWPRLAGLGLLATLTPVVVYLAGSTNPASIEIAAAVGAWAAGSVLVSGVRSDLEGRLVARTGVALCVLVVCRGLSPAFGAVIVISLAWMAGWARGVDLLRSRPVQLLAVALGACTAASAAWLLHIQTVFPPPDRVARGWVAAAGDLGWYLHQCIGVFGNNEVELPIAVSGGWMVLAVAIVVFSAAMCLRAGVRSPRAAVVAVAALTGGVAMCVTAEGLDVPSIGFFWQGRYALPLMFGGLVAATFSAGPEPSRWGRFMQVGRLSIVVAVVFTHLWGFLLVVRHHGGVGSESVGAIDALFRTAWDPPVPIWLAFMIYAVALTLLGLILTGMRPSGGTSTEPLPADRPSRPTSDDAPSKVA